jgi:hypothetical protein
MDVSAFMAQLHHSCWLKQLGVHHKSNTKRNKDTKKEK